MARDQEERAPRPGVERRAARDYDPKTPAQRRAAKRAAEKAIATAAAGENPDSFEAIIGSFKRLGAAMPSDRDTSPEAKSLLTQLEGGRHRTPYDAAPGNGDCTIGIGCKMDSQMTRDYDIDQKSRPQNQCRPTLPDPKMSEMPDDEIDLEFEARVEQAEQDVAATITVPLLQQEFDALVLLLYNIGSDNFAESKTRAAIHNGDSYDTLHEWFGFQYSSGRPWAGLMNRRSEELEVRTSGDYAHDAQRFFRKDE